MTVHAAVADWAAPNQERARALLERYPEKRSAVMPLLYIASLEHGHVTSEAMAEVADLTGLTAAQEVEVMRNIMKEEGLWETT